MTRLHRIFCFVPLFFAYSCLISCASTPKPDLERLYRYQQGNPQQPPIILIPGLFGSRLVSEDGEEAWPGSLTHLIFSNFSDLALEIDPVTLEPKPDGLHAAGLTDKAGGKDFYGRIRNILETAGGFEFTRPGQPVDRSRRRYYVFAYDWRQDNLESVRKLDQLIEQIRADYREPGMKVDLIAHSMGGLIARYYLRYGTSDELTDNEFPVTGYGSDRVRRAILLGTPNLGSMGAIDAMINGKKIGLGGFSPEVLATFPSGYQLLPHPITEWLITSSGEPLKRDIFDARIWQRFEFSIYDPKVAARIIGQFDNPEEGQAYLETLRANFAKRLERARRFTWSLTWKGDDHIAHARLIIFGSDCMLTPARALVEEVDGESVLRYKPDRITHPRPGVDYDRLMLEPGDGVVTKASLLARQTYDPTVARIEYSAINIDYALFLCEAHDQLTGNISFQDNLLQAILTVDDQML